LCYVITPGKLVARDVSVQATISNVLENNRLIAEAALEAGVASPLSQRMAESCLTVNIMVRIMSLRNSAVAVIKSGAPPYRRQLFTNRDQRPQGRHSNLNAAENRRCL
jgi:hypothetical protein